MQIARLDSWVASRNLDEEHESEKPEITENHHQGRAEMVPEPAGFKHPKEHPGDQNHQSRENIYWLLLDRFHAASTHEDVTQIFTLQNLIVFPLLAVICDDITWVRYQPICDQTVDERYLPSRQLVSAHCDNLAQILRRPNRWTHCSIHTGRARKRMKALFSGAGWWV